jgi:GNAT superfamily N-acetyltransferase
MIRMKHSFRMANVEDIDVLIHHRVAMFRDMGRDRESIAQTEIAAREYFSSAVSDGSYRGWLVEADGKVIGGAGVVISAWPGVPGSRLAKRAMILNMYVEREYRRRGIARTLMEHTIAWCKSEGYSAVGLHASDEGRPLYESMGFLPTNEMRLTF